MFIVSFSFLLFLQGLSAVVVVVVVVVTSHSYLLVSSCFVVRSANGVMGPWVDKLDIVSRRPGVMVPPTFSSEKEGTSSMMWRGHSLRMLQVVGKAR